MRISALCSFLYVKNHVPFLLPFIMSHVLQRIVGGHGNMSHFIGRLFHLSQTGLNKKQKIFHHLSVSHVLECHDTLRPAVLIVLSLPGC